MSEIKVKEATLKKHATKLESKGKSTEYLPMKGGNMAIVKPIPSTIFEQHCLTW